MNVRPTRDEFHRLAGEHTVVPVWGEVLGDLETPVAAFAKLVGPEPGFLLESVEHGERWSRFSFVGRNPSATMVLRGAACAASSAFHSRWAVAVTSASTPVEPSGSAVSQSDQLILMDSTSVRNSSESGAGASVGNPPKRSSRSIRFADQVLTCQSAGAPGTPSARISAATASARFSAAWLGLGGTGGTR